MQRQRALADPPLAGAHGHEMTHPGEPVGDAGALLDNLLENSGPSVADDVVVVLHFLTGGLRPAGPPYTLARGGPWAPLRSRGLLAALVRSESGSLRSAEPPGDFDFDASP